MLGPTESILFTTFKRYSVETKDFMTVDNVRIYPASVIFNDAYDGKRFEKKIKIINSGRNVAFVRVLDPTAKVNMIIMKY